MTTTLRLRLAAASAQDNPMMPAPTTARSNSRGEVFMGCVTPSTVESSRISPMNGKTHQGSQRSDKFLVISPPPSRGSIDSLPDLPFAGRDHDAIRRVELEAFRVPGQADEVQHAPRPSLLILGQ